MEEWTFGLILAGAPALVVFLLMVFCGPSQIFSALTAMASEYNSAYTESSSEEEVEPKED